MFRIALRVLQRGAASVAIASCVATTAAAVPVTFQYVPPSPAQKVYLAGTFNSWAATGLEMQKDAQGVFRATVDLGPGKHQYKYVLDGTTWKEDPFAPGGYVDDGFGGKNGVVEVAAGVDKLTVGKAEKAGGGAVSGTATVAPPPPPAGQALTGLRKVTFRYNPPIGGVTQVMLAGTFNDWNVGTTPMRDDDKDGAWEATVMLAPGQYQYKFVADGKWITDQNADGFAPDGFGGQNSVLNVDDRFAAIDVARGDGKFYLDDVRYGLDYATVNPVSPTRLVFTGRAHLNDVEKMFVVYREGQSTDRSVELQPAGEDPAFEYRRAEVEIHDPAGPVLFTFKYVDGGKEAFATPRGRSDVVPAPESRWAYTPQALPVFAVPQWAQDGVIYQIFCDRFFNGDPANDPKFDEPMYAGRTALPAGGKTNGEYFHLVKDWNDIGGLAVSPYRTDGRPDYYSFYGGDIEGVRQKLPYLQDLGVTILYFNPVNVARSNHKYDPCDYLKVDPHFADEPTFKRFVAEAHERGIRIIVDMAYNHTGDCHFAFLDSWTKGPQSPHYTWYEWKQWPVPGGASPGDQTFKADQYYACWWGFGIHPELNFDLSRPQNQENGVRDRAQAQVNQPLVDYVLASAKYWIGDLGIDGFRLDVPNEVPFWFWTLFRDEVRKYKPDAYLVGELWGNAAEWIRPDVFDATMNYKFFRDPVQKFLGQGQGTAESFDRELAPGRWQYPQQAVAAQMNLVDSHDTVRYLTVLNGDRRRLMLSALFAMTYVGAPHIYYGDEVGLDGGKDPDCRRPFPWSWEQEPARVELHRFYKQAIGLRKQHAALRTGSFRSVLADGMLYGFVRESDSDRLLVVLNNADAPSVARLPLAKLGVAGGEFHDLLTQKSAAVRGDALEVSLEALSGAVFELPAAGVVKRK
jgi:glycosidase